MSDHEASQEPRASGSRQEPRGRPLLTYRYYYGVRELSTTTGYVFTLNSCRTHNARSDRRTHLPLQLLTHHRRHSRQCFPSSALGFTAPPTVHTYYDWLCLGSCVRRYYCKEHGWQSKAAHAAGPQCGPCRPNGTPQYTTGHCWTLLDTTALVAPSRPTPQCRISIFFTSRLGLTINNYCFANEYQCSKH